MPDRIFLSLWWRDQMPATMLSRLREVSSLLPPGTKSGCDQVMVTGLDWNQPTLYEQHPQPPMPVAEVLAPLEGQLHDDDACELRLYWDLWTPTPGGWQRRPVPLRLIAIGAEFGDKAAAEQGHLRLDLGDEEPFLAENQPWTPSVQRCLQANVALLLGFVALVDKTLRPRRRKLWSDSEEDLAAKLTRRLTHQGPGPQPQ